MKFPGACPTCSNDLFERFEEVGEDDEYDMEQYLVCVRSLWMSAEAIGGCLWTGTMTDLFQEHEKTRNQLVGEE